MSCCTAVAACCPLTCSERAKQDKQRSAMRRARQLAQRQAKMRPAAPPVPAEPPPSPLRRGSDGVASPDVASETTSLSSRSERDDGDETSGGDTAYALAALR